MLLVAVYPLAAQMAMDRQHRKLAYQTSIRPFRKATYTHFPE
ncbi:TPA: DUF2856 family protein, partial [Escherichia coli]|nr:DUF2856 family protein [Escherichia coli]